MCVCVWGGCPVRRECFRCLCLFPFIYAECTFCQNDGEESGKSPSPQQALLRTVGLVPGTLPWAAGAGGCRDIPAPRPRTLLPQFPWLDNGGGRGAGLRGPCLTPLPRGLLATGSQGLHHHGPSKGLCTTTKRLCPSLGILGVAMVTEGEKGVHLVWGGKGIPGRGHWCTQASGQCG